MRKLEPFVKNYDWGMRFSESMASLFIDADGGQLVSELWWLGETFLVKMLFVGRPLSLQAHPTPEQVAARPGVFPDPYPKPEVIIALTRFEALCGFLSEERVAQNIAGTNLPMSFALLFEAGGIGALIADTRRRVEVLPPRRTLEVFMMLSDLHPTDPAALAPFYMELVCLERGEALVVPGGQPHCYLSGQGVECMPPSDNIARCGLTSKPVDARLFFELCVPQPVAVRTHPYRHEALDPYFRMCCPKGPFLCKKGSVVLRLSADHGAWLVEKDKAFFFNEDEDVLVVSPPS